MIYFEVAWLLWIYRVINPWLTVSTPGNIIQLEHNPWLHTLGLTWTYLHQKTGTLLFTSQNQQLPYLYMCIHLAILDFGVFLPNWPSFLVIYGFTVLVRSLYTVDVEKSPKNIAQHRWSESCLHPPEPSRWRSATPGFLGFLRSMNLCPIWVLSVVLGKVNTMNT